MTTMLKWKFGGGLTHRFEASETITFFLEGVPVGDLLKASISFEAVHGLIDTGTFPLLDDYLA